MRIYIINLCAKVVLIASTVVYYLIFRMVVKPGAQYCGEHTPLPVTECELGKDKNLSNSNPSLVPVCMYRRYLPDMYLLRQMKAGEIDTGTGTYRRYGTYLSS